MHARTTIRTYARTPVNTHAHTDVRRDTPTRAYVGTHVDKHALTHTTPTHPCRRAPRTSTLSRHPHRHPRRHPRTLTSTCAQQGVVVQLLDDDRVQLRQGYYGKGKLYEGPKNYLYHIGTAHFEHDVQGQKPEPSEKIIMITIPHPFSPSGHEKAPTLPQTGHFKSKLVYPMGWRRGANVRFKNPKTGGEETGLIVKIPDNDDKVFFRAGIHGVGRELFEANRNDLVNIGGTVKPKTARGKWSQVKSLKPIPVTSPHPDSQNGKRPQAGPSIAPRPHYPSGRKDNPKLPPPTVSSAHSASGHSTAPGSHSNSFKLPPLTSNSYRTRGPDPLEPPVRK